MKRFEEIRETKKIQFEFTEAEVIDMLRNHSNLDAMGGIVNRLSLVRFGSDPNDVVYHLEAEFSEQIKRTP